MFGALLGGAGLGAIGIGALIGGLGAKQRGGNFLKGALSGAALGGITGGLGAKYGGGEGGIFGFGKKLLPNFLAMSGIGMGTEMLGQQEANKLALEGRRRMFEEEEDERIARLSRIAGYDVADSSNFLTPQSYFGVARGGMMSRPGYYPGGIASVEDDPMDTVNVQEMQMDPGTMGPGELVEEFDFMEEAGSGGDESGWYEMFFNEFGRDPVDINELQLFIDQSDISPTDVAGIGQGPMMAAEGGRVYAAKGRYLERHPGTEDEGFTYDIDIDGDKYDFSFAEKLTDDPEKRAKIIKAIMLEARLKQPTGRLLKDTIDTTADDFKSSGIFSGSEEMFDDRMNFMQDRYDEFINNAVDTGGSDIPPGFDPYMYAKGGITDLDLRGGGHSIGPGTGTSDDIPAMLSDGEFVVTAKAVENLGGGDRMEGAKRMYSMMNQLDPQSQSPGEMNYAGRG